MMFRDMNDNIRAELEHHPQCRVLTLSAGQIFLHPPRVRGIIAIFADMIDRETVDRIYAAANIVDIIGEYVTLKRKGVNYQACCPFHNEKTPSFVVSPSKGVYKCFGCGKGGNAVTFLMEHENITYPEALKMVAKRYGIEVKEKEMSEEEVRRNDDRESMFALNGWAADYFANYLHHETEGMSVGMAYFRQKRGMTDATIKKVRPRVPARARRPDVEGCAGGGI